MREYMAQQSPNKPLDNEAGTPPFIPPVLSQEQQAEIKTIIEEHQLPKTSPGFDAAMRLAIIENYLRKDVGEFPFGHEDVYRSEMLFMSDQRISSIGIELEIPPVVTFGRYLEFYKILDRHGITGRANSNAAWEFSLKPSYSYQTQYLQLEILERLNLIPRDRQARLVPSQGSYSLHATLSTVSSEPMKDKTQYAEDALTLGLGLGLAFSSTNRLNTKKTATAITIDKQAFAMTENNERGLRYEIKILGYGNFAALHNLPVAQRLGSAMLVYHQPDAFPYVDPVIHRIWEETRSDLIGKINQPHELNNGQTQSYRSLSSTKGAAADLLASTHLQREVRHIILTADRRLRHDAKFP